jgi:hypothetical protein
MARLPKAYNASKPGSEFRLRATKLVPVALGTAVEFADAVADRDAAAPTVSEAPLVTVTASTAFAPAGSFVIPDCEAASMLNELLALESATTA